MAERFIYSPETIIKAYSIGVFPMAEAHDSEDIYFYEPDMRGIIPVCPPHIPKKLLKLVRHTQWTVTLDRDFRGVIEDVLKSGKVGMTVGSTQKSSVFI